MLKATLKDLGITIMSKCEIKNGIKSIYMYQAFLGCTLLYDLALIFTDIRNIPKTKYLAIAVHGVASLLMAVMILLHNKCIISQQFLGYFTFLMLYSLHIEASKISMLESFTVARFTFTFACCKAWSILVSNDTLSSIALSIIFQTVSEIYGIIFIAFRIKKLSRADLIFSMKQMTVIYMISIFATYYVMKQRYQLSLSNFHSNLFQKYWKNEIDSQEAPVILIIDSQPIYSNKAYDDRIKDTCANYKLIISEDNSNSNNESKNISFTKKEINFHGKQANLIRYNTATHNDNSGTVDQLLFATVIHELRNPLNIIISILNSTSERIESYALKKEINKALSAASMQECLINDVLDMAKINSGHISINSQATNVHNSIQSIVDLFKYQVSANICFSTIINISPSSAFIIDERRYRQVVLNLLSNSLKFTKSGIIQLQVSYSKGKFNTTVFDTGVGIPHNEQHKIFKKFGMTDNAFQLNNNGTGLGLNLCKRLQNHCLLAIILCIEFH
jgi:two-component sensor histidine kinase